ncbi:IclR family transcriptional regulator domain-containing protein [Labrys wisconsinensis]|uniref:IclR family pca regulon transcriptional regulator n=1 Tax=Labrys wisconsinensis TaxID=425677 RepID=A0ABU0J6M8_9HYPH|nr:IclR family transcriptional regulator C-terminal domain-containing protein [Labrys wisconsinensis]MDQ0469908.1 IclR family pca regulon transcriptional regulator [Labrys wisconsinensis]
MSDERPGDMMGGFAKGLSVLGAFGQGHERLTIAAAARLAGLDRATTRRCLITLQRLGFATFDGKCYALTARVLTLGHAYLASTPLPEQLQPFLDRLAGTIQESCSCSILDGTHIVYIARAAQRRVMSISLGVGSRLPAYCSSMGRVLLAAMTDEEALALIDRSDLQALTARTLTKREDLATEIARVRREGYCIVDEELEIGLRSLAVPIRSRSGRVVAALNTGVQTSRVGLDRLRAEFLPNLLEVQAQLAAVIA